MSAYHHLSVSSCEARARTAKRREKIPTDASISRQVPILFLGRRRASRPCPDFNDIVITSVERVPIRIGDVVALKTALEEPSPSRSNDGSKASR